MRYLFITLFCLFSASVFSQAQVVETKTEIIKGCSILTYEVQSEGKIIARFFPTEETKDSQLKKAENFAKNHKAEESEEDNFISEKECIRFGEGDIYEVITPVIIYDGCTNANDTNGDVFSFTGKILDSENVKIDGQNFMVEAGWWITLDGGTLSKTGGQFADFMVRPL